MSAPLLAADSGPLIALARLNLLNLPSRLFGGLLVTATVWQEVTREPRPADQAALAQAHQDRLLSVVADPSEIPPALADARLDGGESSAIALALLRGAAVLVDERRGRACAISLGLPVVGTLGLLVRARMANMVPAVRPMVDSLKASGYFLAQPLVDRALASIGE